MDLLEYQAKDLFRQAGIPVLPSERIDQSSQLKRLKIPYPIALKSQVRGGGRGKVGGVRFADNTIDAIATAQVLFGFAINGQLPTALLAEAKYQSSEEYYLAIRIDPALRRPVLLGSRRGGIQIDEQAESIQRVAVTAAFAPYHARQLASRMGLQGSLLLAVADVLERMYRLFSGLDLDLIEINPLGVNTAGEVMALDGKVVLNPEGVHRQPQLRELLALDAQSQPGSAHAGSLGWQMRVQQAGMRWIELDPEIGEDFKTEDSTPASNAQQGTNPEQLQSSPGPKSLAIERLVVVSNGAGLLLATLDRIQAQAIPVMGGLMVPERGDPDSLRQSLEMLWEWLSIQAQHPPLQRNPYRLGILLDWVGCLATPTEVLALLQRFHRKLNRLDPLLPLWIRSLLGEWDQLKTLDPAIRVIGALSDIEKN